MKLGSLFDGSGTCPLAASAVGIIPAWASEIEPFPKAVTQSRFPKMVHLGDITKMNGAEIEPVDVITFGSPCQNLSIAGNGKGLAGQESSLFFEAVRVIQEMRCATNGRYPQIAIWENVYGAFSSTQGEDFRTVLETLWQICEGSDSVPRFEEDRSGRQRWPRTGYILGDHSSLAWRGLDAQFWGVAQRRKRVFVVLDLGGQCAGEILFEREGLRRDFKKVKRTGQTVRPASETSPVEHYRVYAVENHASRVSLRPDNTVQTLVGRMGTGGGNVPLVLVPCFGQASYDEYAPTEQAVTLKATGGTYGGGTETLIAVPVQKVFSKGTRPHSKEEGQEWHESQIANTLNVFDMGESRCSEIACIPYTLNIRSGCEGGGKGALISEDKSATLSCNNEQTLFVPTQTENGEVIYLARKLTPTECASLQGFEKDWCALVPHKDSAEYKMWGNGMAFPCMLYIMESVQEVLAERYLDNLFGGDTAEP